MVLGAKVGSVCQSRTQHSSIPKCPTKIRPRRAIAKWAAKHQFCKLPSRCLLCLCKTRVKAGTQNVVEARHHMVSILNLLDLYLCPPSLPSHSSVRSHCCDAEKDQYEALPPPSAKGTKKIWAVASWYFLGTPELHCPGGDGRAS